MRQLLSVTRQHAQAVTTGGQVAHQLDCARRWRGSQCQFALMLQQPGMLGGRFVSGQAVEVGQDVVFGRDAQCLTNRRKVMHGEGQGAVHVEHPMLDVLECHAQSLRWRIRPSCVTEATSLPARL